MTIAIGIAQEKGGAGKTSLTANLGYALASAGRRVLLLDLDQQMSLTRVAFGQQSFYPGLDVGSLVAGARCLDDVVIRGVRPNLDLAPGNRETAVAALERVRSEGPQALFALRSALEASRDYDYVLLDTPGERGPALDVALFASDRVLIPLAPERMCLDAAVSTLDHIDRVRRVFTELSVLGLVFVRAGGNANVRAVMETAAREIAAHRGVSTLKNKIPMEARLLEAELVGQPIGEYDPRARTAIAYRHLAVEIEARLCAPTAAAA